MPKPKPYGRAHQRLAEQVIIAAADELFRAGFDGIEVAHCFIKGGLEYLAVAACGEHQADELEVVADVVRERLVEARGAVN